MINKDQLDPFVVDLGLLIGLLTEDQEGDLSVRTDWFSDPVVELEASPTRVEGLLKVLNSLFPSISGTQYTQIDPNQIWSDIRSATLSTGLSLVTPKPDATSGVLGVGVFDQMFLGDLTISIYGSLPLFYLQNGQAPQFIPAGNLTDFKKLQVAIDVYSATPVEAAGFSFNLLSAAATANFDNSFQTHFALNFYQDFDPATGTKTEAAFPDMNEILVGCLNAVITKANYWLNEYIGESFTTIGDVLSLTGLVTRTQDSNSGATTYSFDQNTLAQLSKDPTAVFKKFLTTLVTDLLDDLVTSGDPLFSISGGGVYAIKDNGNSYGLRISIPNFEIDLGTSAKISLQLGRGFTNETGADSWMQRITNQAIDPGVEIFFLRFDGSTLSTTSQVALNSIGLDISGAGDAPLINLDGYTLKGAELRSYLNSDGWIYGFAIRLDEVAFPVAPSFADTQSGSANTNVVAQNLLAGGGAGSSSDQSAVNPGFSAEAGYISGHDPLLQVFAPSGNQTDLIWFPIQRRFGPINCQKVGLQIDVTGDHQNDPMLGVVFDGGVALGGLNVYLDQLSIDAHLKQIANTSGYGMDLQGIDVDFSSGSIEINGGLLKAIDAAGEISYNGEALIRGSNLTLAAVGSYGSLAGGGTSMFIFGVLNEPLGGPACFYVTGLMAGFGYNRRLKIPDQDKVQEFPLLAGLTDPSAIGGTNPTPSDALTKLNDLAPMQRGEYWLAAGVQFTSFKIVNTNALIIVEFGDDLTIAILGLSILKQPISGNAYVYAELGIEIIILPDQGEFKASAVLAPSSYVLTPDAHLTGGFAFYTWFGNNEHAGDFVLTLGGYHPAFNVPAHYPQEPRLGINWQISDHLSMIGTSYFALTPSAMMAGYGLSLAFEDGDLKAWLKAQADIIIFWKPFYVIADISISVGVSYRLNLLFTHVTLSVEIGADFHLWGPPIGGQVHIDWYVISFTIGFGAGLKIPTSIGWEEFKEMLPVKAPPQDSPKLQSAGHAMSRSTSLRAASPAANAPAYLNVTSNQGLIRSYQAADNLTLWLVRPSQFQFSTGSAIPASAFVVGDPHSAMPLPGIKVGVQRVNGGISADNYQSQQTVTIVKVPKQTSDGDFSNITNCMADAGDCATVVGDVELADIRDWEIDVISKNIPQAMWGTQSGDPSINASSATILATIGVTMYPKAPVITNCTPQMVINDLFEDRTVNADDRFTLPLSQTRIPIANEPQDVDSFADIKSVNDATVFARRSVVFATLAAMGVNAWNNDELDAMAANPGKAFADEPMEGTTVLS